MHVKYIFPLITLTILSSSVVFAQETKLIERRGDVPRVDSLTVFSGALDRNMRCTVILPETYDPAADDHPMLLLLHGRGRHERSLLERNDTKKTLLNAPFVVVMPQGDRSWWIDSPIRPREQYDRYLVELLDLLAKEYRLSRRPERCAATGWSMGGYGAMRFVQHHPDRFGAVAPIIALLDYPRAAEAYPKGQSYPVHAGELGADPEIWKRLNPMADVETLRGKKIFLVTGRDAFDRTMNERFHARLDEKGIPHRMTLLDGTHSLDVVAESLPLVMEFVRNFFDGVPGAKE